MKMLIHYNTNIISHVVTIHIIFYHSKDVLNDLFTFCCLFVFFFFYNFDFKCIPPVKLT